MDTVVNYLEDTEKKLVKEMAELFSKMRGQMDSMSLQGIEDMYSYEPVEGVLYEPCVRIPMSLVSTMVSNHTVPGRYYWTDFALPKDEFVIYKRETYKRREGHNHQCCTFNCIALTSHGRCFITKQVYGENPFGTMQYVGIYSPDANRPVIKLEPLPYKIPTSILKALNLGMSISNIPENYIHHSNQHTNDIHPDAKKTISDTTASLQELNKEFYLFAGKWKPHMTEHATLDVDTMRQTIFDNAHCIEELKGKEASLEEQNKSLQAELKELKEQKTSLEKENTRLLPLEKYKEAVLEFMQDHCPNEEVRDRDDTLDGSIIKTFSDWHFGKVFMNQNDYERVMESKEELNEYRIYKKVKGEMVSSGVDNSGVARNVRSIKKTINKPKN
jgi:DNA-binding transcriptional MerR regulator